MLKQLLQRLAFQVAGIVALAFATGVAVISAAYGLYALLRMSLSAAASAGLTSVAAIILVAVLAVILIQMGKAKSVSHETKARRLDPETLQKGLAVGASLAGLAADALLQWRLARRPDKHRRRGREKRR